jgi:hypothetical protein
MSETMEINFLAKVTKRGPKQPHMTTRCHVWTGSTNKQGYGLFSARVNGKTRSWLAHRWAYEHFVGPIPENHDVCHECDWPPCVRGDHLFTGTRKQNMEDCRRKGRNARGVSHHNAKLTEEQVLKIRERSAQGETAKDLAREYGVNPPAISKIVNRRLWRHV